MTADGQGAGDTTHRGSRGRIRQRRRRLVAIGATIGGVVLVSGIVALLILWSQDSGRSVTVEEARARAGAAGQDSDQPSDSGFRPAAGIYRYRGEGTERLDKPPTSQTQGPDIPGTLTHLEGGGCWRLRVDYNTNHWQSWDYCPTKDGLTENAGAFFQRLDLVVAKIDTMSSYACDPPVEAIRSAQEAGDQWIQECRGTSTGTDGEVISAGPYTYVGSEDLEIGGARVESFHYRRSRTLSGGQTGTEEVDVWFAADTGLLLRNERDIEVRSGSLVGSVTYEEQGSFELTSMTPER